MKLGLVAPLALLTGALVAAAGQPAHAAAATARPACSAAAPQHARCLALVRTDVHGGLGVRGPAARAAGAAASLPHGYGPPGLDAAYNLPVALGAGQTIALVDAYNDPTAEADLATYRETYGLPPCTTANGCFRKVNQAGQAGNYPPADGRVGGRGIAGPGHGVGSLPELPHPARGRQLLAGERSGSVRRHGRIAGCERSVQQLRDV